MVKIIFEVSEDFINEQASEETISAKMKAAEGQEAFKVIIDMIGFKQLKKEVDKGTKEFVVTPDKLDEKSLKIYNGEIGEICVLAAFSETDNKPEEKEAE